MPVEGHVKSSRQVLTTVDRGVGHEDEGQMDTQPLVRRMTQLHQGQPLLRLLDRLGSLMVGCSLQVQNGIHVSSVIVRSGL